MPNVSVTSNILLSRHGAAGIVNLLNHGNFLVAGEVNIGPPLFLQVVHVGQATAEKQYESLLKLCSSWRCLKRPCLTGRIFQRSALFNYFVRAKIPFFCFLQIVGMMSFFGLRAS